MFKVVELLRKQGVSIIYISHRLEEIFRLSDRIEVIRDGEYVTTLITPKATVDELIKLMVGREMTQKYPERIPCIDKSKVMLELKNVCGNGDENMSLKIHAGEVLGLEDWLAQAERSLRRSSLVPSPRIPVRSS